MEDKKKMIKIPRQIRLKTEFFVGFGMEELIKTIIVGAIAGVIAFIYYKITEFYFLYCVLLFIITIFLEGKIYIIFLN